MIEERERIIALQKNKPVYYLYLYLSKHIKFILTLFLSFLISVYHLYTINLTISRK